MLRHLAPSPGSVRILPETEILFYHDGPQVTAGLDAKGRSHLGVRMAGDEPRFLFREIAPAALRDFENGTADLRATLIQGGGDGWFLAVAPETPGAPLELHRQSDSWQPGEHLPEPGFTLPASTP